MRGAKVGIRDSPALSYGATRLDTYCLKWPVATRSMGLITVVEEGNRFGKRDSF